MNKRYYLLIAFLLISISFLSAQTQTFTVKGVSFKMVFVKGGTFTMGATSEQGRDANSHEKPAHRVTLSDYYIGQTEVTQALWKAVMGRNPSNWKGSNLPVEKVSWNDCQQFITKLNQITGRRFRLPTEAEWEYAARGGSKSRGYKYSGSNNLSDVAWYEGNSGSKTHPVAQKNANELGIYDMSGNVYEWCQDWYDCGYYGKSPSTNPCCNNASSSYRVDRGGSWYNSWSCRVSNRSYETPGSSDYDLGLRLALEADLVGSVESSDEKRSTPTPPIPVTVEPAQTTTHSPADTYQDSNGTAVTGPRRVIPDGEEMNDIYTMKVDDTTRQQQSRSLGSSSTSSQNITVTANGVTFSMVFVKGGTFTMGATSEQGSDAESNEKPAHRVTLSDYYIGQTEVTQVLWQAVMGTNPSNRKGSNLPVEQVSWNDCQQFITKLNQITGRKFRLPTEAEWEYAARGGSKSRGYKYSGSNDIGSVAWYDGNSGSKTHPVGQKQANELGIYDMSGNVWEWCQDWYDSGYYGQSPSTNPCNNTTENSRVFRGGGWIDGSWIDGTGYCRVSFRGYEDPGSSFDILGLRLVLSGQTTAPQAPTTTQQNPKPTPTQQQPRSLGSSTTSSQIITITVNGITFTMVKVQGSTFTMGATSEQGSAAESNEKPVHRVTLSDYYIGQTEVTQALWQAVMGTNPSNWKGSNLPVEQVSWDDCQQFITKLNQLTGRRFRLPTEAEWEYAARGGNKSRGYKYSGSNDLGSVAWYDGNSGSKTHPVGQKQVNELGIYDMSGNVWEWCQDWYDSGYYGKTPSSNPCNTSPSHPLFDDYGRVGRGGGWFSSARGCRVSNRASTSPGGADRSLGLRLAL